MKAYGIMTVILLTAAPVCAAPAFAQISLGAKPQQMLYVAINANDFDAMRYFYTAVIGLKELPGGTPIAKPRSSTSLSFTGAYDDSFLMLSHDDEAPRAGSATLQRVAFKVADVRAIVARARVAGAAVLHEPAAAHGMAAIQSASIRDPDGNEIELVEVRP